MQHSSVLQELLQRQKRLQKLYAASGATPAQLFGKLGLVPPVSTCYPTRRLRSRLGKKSTDEDVVVYNNVVTSQGAGSTFLFAVELGELLYDGDRDKANVVCSKLLLDRGGKIGFRRRIQIGSRLTVPCPDEIYSMDATDRRRNAETCNDDPNQIHHPHISSTVSMELPSSTKSICKFRKCNGATLRTTSECQYAFKYSRGKKNDHLVSADMLTKRTTNEALKQDASVLGKHTRDFDPNSPRAASPSRTVRKKNVRATRLQSEPYENRDESIGVILPDNNIATNSSTKMRKITYCCPIIRATVWHALQKNGWTTEKPNKSQRHYYRPDKDGATGPAKFDSMNSVIKYISKNREYLKKKDIQAALRQYTADVVAADYQRKGPKKRRIKGPTASVSSLKSKDTDMVPKSCDTSMDDLERASTQGYRTNEVTKDVSNDLKTTSTLFQKPSKDLELAYKLVSYTDESGENVLKETKNPPYLCDKASDDLERQPSKPIFTADEVMEKVPPNFCDGIELPKKRVYCTDDMNVDVSENMKRTPKIRYTASDDGETPNIHVSRTNDVTEDVSKDVTRLPNVCDTPSADLVQPIKYISRADKLTVDALKDLKMQPILSGTVSDDVARPNNRVSRADEVSEDGCNDIIKLLPTLSNAASDDAELPNKRISSTDEVSENVRKDVKVPHEFFGTPSDDLGPPKERDYAANDMTDDASENIKRTPNICDKPSDDVELPKIHGSRINDVTEDVFEDVTRLLPNFCDTPSADLVQPDKYISRTNDVADDASENIKQPPNLCDRASDDVELPKIHGSRINDVTEDGSEDVKRLLPIFSDMFRWIGSSEECSKP